MNLHLEGSNFSAVHPHLAVFFSSRFFTCLSSCLPLRFMNETCLVGNSLFILSLVFSVRLKSETNCPLMFVIETLQQVQQEMRRECKCHGMSGSCTVKTCWMRLPSFRDIGNNIKDRFDGASRIMHGNQVTNRAFTKRNRFELKPSDPTHKAPTKKDLVYFEHSPDFCTADHRLGVTGTRGRVCNDTSLGVDGCELMCCGRGFKTEIREELERCNCTFQWCCTVHCKICKTRKTVHTCL